MAKYSEMSSVTKIGIWGSLASIVGLVFSVYLMLTETDATEQTITTNGGGSPAIGKNSGPITIVTPDENKMTPQSAAQAMRVSTSALRSIAQRHIPYPPPPEWIEAEKLLQNANVKFRKGDFLGALEDYKAANTIYQDLYYDPSGLQ